MGVFRQNIRIISGYDLALLRAGRITEPAVRQTDVPFLMGSGAFMMCINETIQQPELPVVSEHEVILADGSAKHLKMVTGLEGRVFNRRTLTGAVVLPENTEPLLGSIYREALDVIVDPKTGELRLPPAPIFL